MNYIDKLLQGKEVEWKTLGEVTKYEQPTKYRVKSTDYNDDFNTPVLTAGKTFILGYTNEVEGIYKASQNPVIIFDDFTTANKWVDFDFKVKSSAMKLITSVNEEEVPLKYIYYWLNTLPSGLIEGDHKRQWISNFANMKIPIPPLEIQQEIVSILDKFTELTARKKQYEYYREELLSFDENEVEWKTLGEVFNLRNGYTPSKANQEYWSNGTIPWFRMEDIRENGKVLEKSIQNINTSAVKGGKLFPANSIIIATSATIGEHALVTVPYLSNQRFTNLSLKNKFVDRFQMKFLFYYCFLLCEWCKKNTTMSSFASVDMVSFRKFKIPIPPLEEQERIVSILDKFDTLTTSISEGLPKEIELRQKQYEYYRDLLLTFPKKETI